VHVPLKPGSRRSGNSEGAGAFLLHQAAIRRHDKRRPQCGVSVHSIISQPRDCDLFAAPDRNGTPMSLLNTRQRHHPVGPEAFGGDCHE
jgi:hypothetical protein